MTQIDVRVPKWGLSIDEVTITEWLKGPGDVVAEGDILCEVDTDKSSTELESPAAGTLTDIVAEAGATCAVGDVIAHIESN